MPRTVITKLAGLLTIPSTIWGLSPLLKWAYLRASESMWGAREGDLVVDGLMVPEKGSWKRDGSHTKDRRRHCREELCTLDSANGS